jgi:hypothetical protein
MTAGLAIGLLYKWDVTDAATRHDEQLTTPQKGENDRILPWNLSKVRAGYPRIAPQFQYIACDIWAGRRLVAQKIENAEGKMVPTEGFEPPTTRLRSGCSTTELRRLECGH